MAQKRRFVQNKRQLARTDSAIRGLRRPPDVIERPAPQPGMP